MRILDRNLEITNKVKELVRKNTVVPACWKRFIGPKGTVLIFDTETTGLESRDNNLLAISWQLLRLERRWGAWRHTVLEERRVCFDWPEDESRVTMDAIYINGLTKEKLAKIGTISRPEGLALFIDALDRAGAVVAHNISFDIGFIIAEARREGFGNVSFPNRFCTMEEMTEWCGIFRWDCSYILPSLDRLAARLKVDRIGDKVEITKQCFMKILETGVLPYIPEPKEAKR